MKKYCMSCGSPTDYSIKIPLYCSNCGKSFDIINKPIEKAQIQAKTEQPTKQKLSKFRIRPNINSNQEYNHDELEDGEEINYVPNIKNLDVETIIEEAPKENLGKLLLQNNKNKIKNNSTKNKKIRKK